MDHMKIVEDLESMTTRGDIKWELERLGVSYYAEGNGVFLYLDVGSELNVPESNLRQYQVSRETFSLRVGGDKLEVCSEALVNLSRAVRRSVRERANASISASFQKFFGAPINKD